MHRRVLSVLLVLCMAITLLPAAVFAGNDTDGTVKEKICVVLVSGQSNAAGVHGSLDVPAITPDEGNGYWWDGDKLTDLKAQVDTYTTSVGWYSALAAEWYELTGEKVVIIRSTHSGSSIKGWAGYDGAVKSYTTSAAAEVVQCIAAIQADDTKEIVRTGYYWLQGETDAFIKTNKENEEYPTIEQYEAAYMAMHEKFVEALTVENVPAPVGGILSCRTRTNGNYKNLELCSMRAAQQHMANTADDIYMASVITENWTGSNAVCAFTSASGKYSVNFTASQMINSIHYNQSGYNAMGLDAADNMYAALVGTAPAVTDIAVIAHDGISIYQDGAVIEVTDNLRIVDALNKDYDTDAAQIAFRPLPISAAHTELTVTVTDEDGSAVTDVIDETGRIADIGSITWPLTLTVSAGSVVKTFTLRHAENEPPSFHYYWDFTDAESYDNTTVSSKLDENNLTYSGTSITYNEETGLANTKSKYFTAAKSIELQRDAKWTIRWKGSHSAKTGTLLSDNSSDFSNGSRTTPYLYIINGENSKYRVDLRQKSTKNGTYFDVADVLSEVHTWTLTNNRGTLTLSNENGVIGSKALSATPAVYSFDGVLGRFGSGSGYTLCYAGNIEFLDIYSADRAEDILGIEITAAPEKTVYGEGERFDPEGMVVSAINCDGTSDVITDYSVAPEVIASNTVSVTVSYTANGRTFTAELPVTVLLNGGADCTNYKWTWGGTDKPDSVTADIGDNTLTKVSGKSYYSAASTIELSSEKEWVIEWKGPFPTKNGILLSDNGSASTYLYPYWNDSKTAAYVEIRKVGGKTVQFSGIEDLSFDINDNELVWRISHKPDTSYTLTILKNGSVLYTDTLTHAKDTDIAFNYVMGYYTSSSPLPYRTAIDYIRIYEKGVAGVEALLKEGTYLTGDILTADDLTVSLTMTDGEKISVSDFSLSGDDLVISDQPKTASVSFVYENHFYTATVEFKSVLPTYRWEFNTAHADGRTLKAVSGGNDLIWNSETVQLRLDETKLTAGGSYFRMEEPVVLPADMPWTVEWKGVSTAQSVLLANNTGVGDTTEPRKDGEYVYIFNDLGRENTNSVSLRKYNTNSAATFSGIHKNDRRGNLTWYLSHDGSGSLILTAENSGVVVYMKEIKKAVSRDYTFNSVLGYFTQDFPMEYTGTIEYLQISYESTEKTVPSDLVIDVSGLEKTKYIPGESFDPAGIAVKSGETVLYSFSMTYAPETLAAGENVIRITAEIMNQTLNAEITLVCEDVPEPETHAWISAAGKLRELEWDDCDTAKNAITWKNGYYETERPIYLNNNRHWQISWTGAPNGNAVLLSDNTAANVSTGNRSTPYLYIRNGGDNGAYDIRLILEGNWWNSSVCFDLEQGDMAADTRWQMDYRDGVLTLVSSDGYSKSVNITLPNFSFNGIGGYFVSDVPLNYKGTLSQISILEEVPDTVTLSGFITSYGDPAGEVTVELWQDTTKIDTVITTDGTYSFEDVKNGSYIIKVSKANHVSRSYRVEVVID